MKIIKYTITFHSYWHCGSGLVMMKQVNCFLDESFDGLAWHKGQPIFVFYN